MDMAFQYQLIICESLNRSNSRTRSLINFNVHATTPKSKRTVDAHVFIPRITLELHSMNTLLYLVHFTRVSNVLWLDFGKADVPRACYTLSVQIDLGAVVRIFVLRIGAIGVSFYQYW